MRRAPLGLLTLVLSGCAVGPNFKRPEPPRIDRYLPEEAPQETQSAPTTGGASQRLIPGMAIPAKWWQLFHSEQLDALIEQAFKNNPSVLQAQAALRQAEENYRAGLGAFLPEVQGQYAFERQRNATGTLAPTLSSGTPVFNLHTAQLTVTYALDVFGGARRQAESLHALADSQRFQLEATYLTLAANVITTAIQEASARAQLAASDDIVKAEGEALKILNRQYELGSIAYTDVMAQEATLATTEATIPPIRKQLEQSRHAMAILLGGLPGEPQPQAFQLTDLELPTDVPLSVPSELVRRRPDVLAAEAQMHSASAQVGVAVANMLPQISLTAQEGGAATQFNQLFAAGNRFWSGGASLTQTLFAGGELLHKERAARAALDQAGAQYRSAVLTAFQNVADALSALQLDATALNASQRAVEAARNSLGTVRRNVELGSVGYLALLNAQQTYQQALLALAQAQANRFSDTAALFQALGGDWWTREGSSATSG